MSRHHRHPEAAEALRHERAAARSEVTRRAAGDGWRPDYGWLVRLMEPSGTRHYHDIPPGTSYEDALAQSEALVERLRETRPIDRAWLEKKMFEPYELRRWQRAGELRTSEFTPNPYTDDGGED